MTGSNEILMSSTLSTPSNNLEFAYNESCFITKE